MLKKIALIIFITILKTGFSQDTIYKTLSDIIPCKIVHTTDSLIYYRTDINQKELSKIKQSSIDHYVIFKKESKKENKATTTEFITLGFGIGQDYGGIGLNAIIYPQKNIGLFGSYGFIFSGMGYNVGLKLRKTPQNQESWISPYLIGMYGYTSSYTVIKYSHFNEVFYGFSAGIGIDLKLKSESYLSFGINIPFRSNEEKDFYENNSNSTLILPVTFSVGFKKILSFHN